jgi:hypothetical protein
MVWLQSDALRFHLGMKNPYTKHSEIFQAEKTTEPVPTDYKNLKAHNKLQLNHLHCHIL